MPRPDFVAPSPVLSVVVPLYEEEAVVPPLIERLARVLDEIDVEAEVILVDDGSRDGTPSAISRVSHRPRS